MTKYLQRSFSVGGSPSRTYSDNWEKTFGKGAEAQAAAESEHRCAECGALLDLDEAETAREWTARGGRLVAAIYQPCRCQAQTLAKLTLDALP